MSADAGTHVRTVGHAAELHHHGHEDHGDGGFHATFGGYATGFVLSVILTAIPFWLVMTKAIDRSSTMAIVILALAAVQIVVHMVYFLHLNSKAESGWTMMALIFTVVLVVIMLSG